MPSLENWGGGLKIFCGVLCENTNESKGAKLTKSVSFVLSLIRKRAKRLKAVLANGEKQETYMYNYASCFYVYIC